MEKLNSVKYSFIILLILSTTLTYYSPYNYILAFISIVILMLLSLPKKIAKNSTIVAVIIFIFLYIDGFRVFSSSFEYSQERMFVLYFSFFLFFFVVNYFKKEKNFELFVKAIEFVLIFHLILWFIQFIGLYLANYHIDYLEMIVGKESRAYPKHIAGMILHRPTGLSNEPGGYAIDTVILLYASYIIKEKLTRLHILVITSYFLSLTLFGMIFGFLLVLIEMAKKIKKITATHIILFLFVLLPIFILFLLYISFRLEDGNNGSLIMKLQSIFWLFEQDIYRILLGSGFGINDFGGLIADTSIYFNLFFTFGIFGIVFYLLLIFLLRKSFLHQALLSIYFLGKTKLYFMSFWFFLAMLFLTYYKKIGYKK